MIEALLKARHARRAVGVILGLSLAACDVPAQKDPLPEPGVFSPTSDGPPGAPPGTCWGRTVSPAVVQTIKEQVQVEPAQINADGTVTSLPVYRTEERQQIVTPRKDTWFETPCPAALTPEFISSLQRALAARGAYGGPITGVMDAQTRSAVAAFQRPGGPDSEVLTLETARQLGLIAAPRVPSE